mmetsp:Transcript_111041/g.319110  ORF Transcript_111041/g.319110 Transcript_111041/m.319110 type:complete len:133 (+) Transcript_111041:925-1323(+)
MVWPSELVLLPRANVCESDNGGGDGRPIFFGDVGPSAGCVADRVKDGNGFVGGDIGKSVPVGENNEGPKDLAFGETIPVSINNICALVTETPPTPSPPRELAIAPPPDKEYCSRYRRRSSSSAINRFSERNL